MSQPHNPADTQALLQSMLQRLKLQSGRDGHAHLHTPVPITAASMWGQDGVRGASSLHKPNNSHVNGCEFGANGVPSKEFGISAVDSNFGLKGGKVGRNSLTSFSTLKDNTDGNTGEKGVLEQASQPGITPTGTGQVFPAKSPKDADITSFEATDGERLSFGSSAMTGHISTHTNAVTSMGQNQDQEQSFRPKVYMWSLKPSDVNVETVSSDSSQVLQMENGDYVALEQSKDIQIVSTDQERTNSLSRRKQRPSENKTRRWTQKIKERWKDRPGSFGKKGREEGDRVDQRSPQGTEMSHQNQQPETLTKTSNEQEERTLTSLGNSGPCKTPPTHTEDRASGEYMSCRSASDFEFGLGSFSLLDEIVTGQEWAKFLNPNLSAASANQRPPVEPLSPPNLPPNPSVGISRSPVPLNREGGGDHQWSVRSTEASPLPDFSMAHMSPDAFQPVSMDLSEGKQQQCVHREADQSEPMEHGHSQSHMQSGGSGQQRRPPSFAQPTDNSALKSRVQLNRKRQHQPAERPQTEKINDDGFTSSPSKTGHAIQEAADSQHDSILPLYILNSSPTSIYPSSSSSPFASAPKGVLKHSISQDSETSVEVVTKRRRVEDHRRVRFSEEVVTIVPPGLDVDATDSEEDSGAEEDSVAEEGCEVAAVQEVAPARRHALPAWILALKRRNTGRKHR